MTSKNRSAARYISKLSNKIRRKLDSLSSKGNFSGAQGKVLHFILAQSSDMFQKDIEDEFSLRPSSATELLKQMEKGGLIRREPVDYDGRLKRITVTEKALGYREQVVRNLADMEEELLRGVSREELNIFFKVVEQMLDNLSI